MRRLTVLVLIAVLACGGDGPRQTDSGVEGIATSGPQCPVEVAGSPCPDAPIAVEIVVTKHGSADPVGRARSASDGTFRIPLAPGEYTIAAASPGPPSLAPLDVVVRAHRFTRVTLEFDSGIR